MGNRGNSDHDEQPGVHSHRVRRPRRHERGVRQADILVMVIPSASQSSSSSSAPATPAPGWFVAPRNEMKPSL